MVKDVCCDSTVHFGFPIQLSIVPPTFRLIFSFSNNYKLFMSTFKMLNSITISIQISRPSLIDFTYASIF